MKKVENKMEENPILNFQAISIKLHEINRHLRTIKKVEGRPYESKLKTSFFQRKRLIPHAISFIHIKKKTTN